MDFDYKVDCVEITKGFDQKKGTFFDFPEDIPNSYGFEMNLLVIVKLSRRDGFDPNIHTERQTKLVLTVDAPAFESQVGRTEAWQQEFSVFVVAYSSQVQIPFLIPYRCYPEIKVNIKASLYYRDDEPKKNAYFLPCAE